MMGERSDSQVRRSRTNWLNVAGVVVFALLIVLAGWIEIARPGGVTLESKRIGSILVN